MLDVKCKIGDVICMTYATLHGFMFHGSWFMGTATAASSAKAVNGQAGSEGRALLVSYEDAGGSGFQFVSVASLLLMMKHHP